MSLSETRNPSALDVWLHQAAAHLSSASAARIRQEIVEHYEAAYEDATSRGAGSEEAQRHALMALGDAKNVNRRYREVMLTCSDARALRQGNVETRFVCAQGRKLWILPVAAFGAAIWCLVTGKTEAIWPTLLVAFGMALVAVPFLLPVNTLVRSRIYRGIRWAWLVAVFAWAFGPDYRSNSWLIMACAWPIAWCEWKLALVRRKLPVSQWPKPLFL